MTDEAVPITSDTVTESLYALLARTIKNCGRIRKDQIADTGKYTYSYTSLTDILVVVKAALATEGLVVSQPIRSEDGMTYVDTLLIHEQSGDRILFPGLGGPTKGDPQANGSAITYARRYNLTSLFALEVEDDDGATAAREANAAPGERTEAEKLVRAKIAGLDDDERHAFIADFKFEFGMGLTDLPMSKHGEALTWTNEWNYTAPEPSDADDGTGY